ncbi:hypothetical protein XELAEV_18000516mg [Xenopus laevis]|uniref:Uncharacterized protein n=1 Tax=Xenopus laevis TaxID=8355 RepID=A0A974BQ14_XENLA|nr:hypothetical protein XELAEV_18000516mg [Xenopus laevis]
MASKFMGKTYEKQSKKNAKQLAPNSPILCQSQKMLSQDSVAVQEHASIASEVARLLNPVIEQSINKAIAKLQIEISKISQHLDYSVFLSQKRKEFSNSCQQLVSLGINFALLYPAKLKKILPSGPRIFGYSSEAQRFVEQLVKHKNNNSLFPNISTILDHPSFLPQREHKGNRFERSRQVTQSITKEPSFSRDHKKRSRSRSPISHKSRSPLNSSEDDVVLES